MRKILFGLIITTIAFSCKNAEVKSATDTKDTTAAATKPAVDLPYTADYESNWSDNVSDADLKMVLTTYKDWTDGNMPGLEAALADTTTIDMSSGTHIRKPKADIINMWKTNRDSLSSVKIKMDAWHKMYATDKGDAYVVTWYNEYDTYKNGRVDSAAYHDINQIKDGKLVWYSQYKRPLK